MAFNNGYNSYSSFRQEDGKVIGRIRTGVKTASPAAGELDYRFLWNRCPRCPGAMRKPGGWASRAS